MFVSLQKDEIETPITVHLETRNTTHTQHSKKMMFLLVMGCSCKHLTLNCASDCRPTSRISHVGLLHKIINSLRPNTDKNVCKTGGRNVLILNFQQVSALICFWG